jgi:hypothetical protein
MTVVPVFHTALIRRGLDRCAKRWTVLGPRTDEGDEMRASMIRISAGAMGAAAVTAAVAIGACGGSSEAAGGQDPDSASVGLPQGSEHVELDPSAFTTEIDNPYWPMTPGSRWVYSETDTVGGHERVVVKVTRKTKMIANGIEARVIRDTVTEHGVPVEVTDDWYAQDSVGNIWYLGEYVTNYKHGRVVDHGGSFEAGVDGAEPGIAMPANPEPGMSYRREYYEGEAEDKGAVVTVGEERVQVPLGFFNREVLMTRDLVPTEPRVEELKFYVPDVGPVLSVHTDGTGGRGELVSYQPG